MSRWAKQFPYLYMSKEELQAIPNDTLTKLVADFMNDNWDDKCDSWMHQTQRLAEEKLRRQFAGLIEPPASWATHNKEVYDA